MTIVGLWTLSNCGQAECTRFNAGRGIEVDRLLTDHWTLDPAVEDCLNQQARGKAVFVA
ncbi:MAG: hypothetical protein NVS3B5_17850 [Sphingomicrobium sp.]